MHVHCEVGKLAVVMGQTSNHVHGSLLAGVVFVCVCQPSFVLVLLADRFNFRQENDARVFVTPATKLRAGLAG